LLCPHLSFYLASKLSRHLHKSRISISLAQQTMHALIFLLALPLALAIPSRNSAAHLTPRITTYSKQLSSLFQATSDSDACKLASPGETCTGIPLKDIIVSFGKTCSPAQRELLVKAVKGSGSKVVYDWGDFGFSAFVPEPVVGLVRAHTETFGGKVYDNACFEIPWCGEAPC
ncbi:hypothetical protein B0J11DRAFT_603267, partial [Dendryphion nanum]